ncbi:MAG TPA: nucleotide disphospho-sugar-binding domain-containing protein [Terrimicrobiaceae bacterium]
MTTLGNELKRRGHRVTLIARPDAQKKSESAGLEFLPFGERDFPVGSVARTTARLGQLGGLKAIRFTAEMLRRAAVAILDEAPGVITGAEIDALLVDQVTPAGNAVAEILRLPFVTVCNALALDPDPALPPAVTPWRYRQGRIWRVRNAFGDAVFRWIAKPIMNDINARRLRHGLPRLTETFSESASLAQIAQQPAFFDYPRERLPASFHYTGPWHAIDRGDAVEFPWQRLDGRPLIYASMGTLQNRQRLIFETIAAACAGLDAQLVLSLGSRDHELEGNYAGAPVVVPFAPQLELLRRAALTITHAGLNTALESLAQGVPMVAVPIANDQPGVASRLEWLGVAEVVTPSRLTVPRLRASVRRVLGKPHYRARSQQWKAEIARGNGLTQAADVVERALGTRQPVLRP